MVLASTGLEARDAVNHPTMHVTAPHKKRLISTEMSIVVFLRTLIYIGEGNTSFNASEEVVSQFQTWAKVS